MLLICWQTRKAGEEEEVKEKQAELMAQVGPWEAWTCRQEKGEGQHPVLPHCRVTSTHYSEPPKPKRIDWRRNRGDSNQKRHIRNPACLSEFARRLFFLPL